MKPILTQAEADAFGRERPWEIWAFGAAFVLLFFLFVRSQSGPEAASAVPKASSSTSSGGLFGADVVSIEGPAR